MMMEAQNNIYHWRVLTGQSIEESLTVAKKKKTLALLVIKILKKVEFHFHKCKVIYFLFKKNVLVS